MSVLMMATTLTIIGLRIHNVHSLANFNPEVVADGSDAFGSHFAKLHGPSSRVRIERSLGALLSFCVWLRIFKYTRSVPVFGTIGRTITRAFPAVRPSPPPPAPHLPLIPPPPRPRCAQAAGTNAVLLWTPPLLARKLLCQNRSRRSASARPQPKPRRCIRSLGIGKLGTSHMPRQ